MPRCLRTCFAMLVAVALDSCDATEAPLDPPDDPGVAGRLHGRLLRAQADSLISLIGWTVGGCSEGRARTSTDAAGEWSISLESLQGSDLCYFDEDTIYLREEGGTDTSLKVRILEPNLNLSVASSFVRDPRDGEV